eukprot:scaffold191361_cov46-Cyclotella_meneghiniana.AAC.1
MEDDIKAKSTIRIVEDVLANLMMDDGLSRNALLTMTTVDIAKFCAGLIGYWIALLRLCEFSTTSSI